MPQFQFLGTLPQKRNFLAEALEKGTESFIGARGRVEEQRRYEKEQEVDLSSIDYEKKAKAANMIMEAKKHMGDEQAAQLDANPKVKALFEDLGWPYPEGSLMGKLDIKTEAIAAVGQGVPLPGMTMEETKKAAGVLIPEKKITGTDVKAFEKATPIPFVERLWPGAQTRAGKERLEFRKRFREQFIKGGRKGTTGDPLNVR